MASHNASKASYVAFASRPGTSFRNSCKKEKTVFRRFRVQNFMCLKDVTVDLEPLTIFVGPNSSGKSAFFKALTTFSRLFWYPVRGGRTGDFNIEPGVTLDDVVWNGDTGLPIIFEAWLAESQMEDPDYTMELCRGFPGWSIAREKFLFQGEWLDTSQQQFEFETSQGPISLPRPYKALLAYLTQRFNQDSVAGPHLEPIQDLRLRLGQARRYRPSAPDIACSVKPLTTTGTPDVDETGRNVPLALQDLLTTDRDTFTAMEGQLQNLHSHIRGITFKSDWRGVGFRYKSNRTTEPTPASLESDGVLLSTFLVWRMYSAPANLKLCLEEPENGVHLSSLKQCYQLLKRFATESEKHRNLQILIATHSRDFLNAIESRNDIIDEVRVTEFGPDSGTAIHTVHHYREIDQLLTEFRYQMGDLWWSGRLQHGLRQ